MRFTHQLPPTVEQEHADRAHKNKINKTDARTRSQKPRCGPRSHFSSTVRRERGGAPRQGRPSQRGAMRGDPTLSAPRVIGCFLVPQRRISAFREPSMRTLSSAALPEGRPDGVGWRWGAPSALPAHPTPCRLSFSPHSRPYLSAGIHVAGTPLPSLKASTSAAMAL